MPGAARAAGPPAPAGGRGARARGVVLRMQAREEKHASAEGGRRPGRRGALPAAVRSCTSSPSGKAVALPALLSPARRPRWPAARRTDIALYGGGDELVRHTDACGPACRSSAGGSPTRVPRGSLWIFDSQLNFVFVSASGFNLHWDRHPIEKKTHPKFQTPEKLKYAWIIPLNFSHLPCHLKVGDDFFFK